MRFFYDTEFIETAPSDLGEHGTPGRLDLISIGVVSEDGREFYACNQDCDLGRAPDWVRLNVIPRLPQINSELWMPLDALRDMLLDFLRPHEQEVELWGDYAGYDHVLLCWVFGAVIELPKGMPMLTMDLEQFRRHLGGPPLPEQDEDSKHDALEDARWLRRAFLHLERLMLKDPSLPQLVL